VSGPYTIPGLDDYLTPDDPESDDEFQLSAEDAADIAADRRADDLEYYHD
jgi:hypothetical protein